MFTATVVGGTTVGTGVTVIGTTSCVAAATGASATSVGREVGCGVEATAATAAGRVVGSFHTIVGSCPFSFTASIGVGTKSG